MNYCTQCGAKLVYRTPPDDDRPRYLCEKCGFIHYENPKIVVGTIPEYKDRILLCRRAIKPCYGLWTLPAGFMENDETVEQGALRETLEEAGAKVIHPEPFALFNLAFISQVYIMFRAQLPTPEFSPGHESLAVALFAEADIPWDQIAFPVIKETLRLFLSDRQTAKFTFHLGTIASLEKKRPSRLLDTPGNPA